jgi:hypothetical protein
MRSIHVLALLSVALVTLGGCGADEAAQATPADFALVYDWREGSLPPPYHYSYTIRMKADGAGELVFVPGYSGSETPIWTETFSVSSAQRSSLYTLMREKGLFSREWPPSDELRVGGSTEWLQVTANGTQVQLPPQLRPGDDTTLSAVYASINNLVPAEVWTKIRQEHQQYQDLQQP